MIHQHTPWYLFWNSLNTEEKRLFRLLQMAHRELGKDSKMFSYGYLGIKNDIKEFVMGKFSVDLDDLPRDR